MLDQFYKFLGPELKAVTGESQGIDDVMVRVQGLIGPLEKVRGQDREVGQKAVYTEWLCMYTLYMAVYTYMYVYRVRWWVGKNGAAEGWERRSRGPLER